MKALPFGRRFFYSSTTLSSLKGGME
jgi:hypothetical protein